MNKMNAVVSYGKNDFCIAEVEIPVPTDDEVLCRIKSVAICGSDPGLFSGHYASMGWPPSYPFIFGHEWTGEVIKTGKRVTSLRPGDRVAGEAHSGCGICRNCREGNYNLCLNYGNLQKGHRHYGFLVNGAYAQYGVFTAKSCTKIPDNVSYDDAALCDSAGTALQAVRLADIRQGETVAVYGPGPIGNLAMQIARTKGAHVIVIGRGARLDACLADGADEVIDYEKHEPLERLAELTGGMGADAVIECAGTDTAIYNSVMSARKNGRVVLVSMPKNKDLVMPVNTIVCNQIHVTGSRANPNCCPEILKLLAEGRIRTEHLITHRFPMTEMAEALDIFSKRKDGAVKVIVHP